MANFNGSIDLLALNGATLCTGIGGAEDKRPYVCIPIDLNEIKVATSSRDANKVSARLRIHISPLNEKYKNAIRKRALEQGEQKVSVPSMSLQMSFSLEYMKAVIKAYPQLVEQVKEAQKAAHPGIENQDPTDEKTELFKQISYRLNKNLSNLYLQEDKPQTQYTQPSAAQVGGINTYVPPAEGTSMDDYTHMPGYNDPNSDLPF